MKTENLKTAFELFCTQDSFRPVMVKPFELKGKIYATDGMSLICCNKDICNFEINNEHTPPLCDKVMPKPNTNKIINIDKNAFDIYKTEDIFKIEEEKNTCNACDGSREVEWNYGNYKEFFYCPVCKGEAIVVIYKRIPTGEKTFIENSYVKLNDVYIAMSLFYRLIQVRELLGGKIILLYINTPNKQVLFQIAECKILLMPTQIHGNIDALLEIQIKL